MTAATSVSAVGHASVSDIGANHRTWTIESAAAPVNGLNAKGEGPQRTVVEIATGMNYWDGQEWTPSVATFDVTPDAFVANRLQYMVNLNDNLNRMGAVTVVTRDGVTLHSTPVAIGLFDAASGRSRIIAGITDSSGVLINGNKVVYRNAFSGVAADVVYSIDRASFEQDVVITDRLDPEDYAFPRETTRIQIYTEFYDAPKPHKIRRPIQVEERENVRKRMVSPDLIDEVLGFGEFVLATGRAFNSAAAAGGSAAPVAKEFVTKAGRTFLIESVEYLGIQKELEALAEVGPRQASVQKARGRKLDVVDYAAIPSAGHGNNAQVDPHAKQNTARVASANLAVQKGLVIDYKATVGGALNTPVAPFQGDTTYYVSGAVICNGPATIEGGAVFKFKHQTTAPAGYASIKFNSTLTCKTSSYRPAIFTAVDDDSVGETMLGYAPGYQQPVRTDGYANPAIWLYNLTAQNLSNLRFSYCQEAVRVEGGSGHTLSHAQLVKCIRGIVITGSGCGSACSMPITVNNGLFSNVSSPITISRANVGPAFYHCTVDSSPPVATLITCPVGNGVCSFYNCAFANITALNSGPVSMQGDYNGFYSCPQFGTHTVVATPPTSPFQSKGAGNYYLAANSLFRNAGTTTGINSSLLADLRKRTTDPPVDPPASGPSSTFWNPVAFRDGDALDLGYHYAPLDYLVSDYTMGGAPHVLTDGVALGFFGARGITTTGGGGFFSEGRADALNRLVWYPSVQEQPALLNNTSTRSSSLFSIATPDTDKTISLRFTEIAMLGLPQAFFEAAYPVYLPMLFLRDCQLGGVNLKISSYWQDAQIPASVTVHNTLLERCTVELFNGYIHYYYATDLYNVYQDPLSVTLYNNLFFGSTLTLRHQDAEATYHLPWVIKDNLFDSATISFSGDGNYLTLVDRSNNGFYSTPTSTQLGGTANKDLTALTYATAGLGSWYIASSTPTIADQGSRTAVSAQLYHYTILSNQQKEQSSQVDIGFHYVALNPQGLPFDTDSDGLADYLEDTNGNSVYDAGDRSDFANRDTDGDGIPDGWEWLYGFDPSNVSDGPLDADGDGLSNYAEYIQGRNPRNAGTIADSSGTFINLKVFTP